VPSQKNIVLTIGKMEAAVDGSPYTLVAEPYIDAESERTLVPVRFVSEALGAEVQWDPAGGQITVSYGDKEILLTPASNKITVNGEENSLDGAPEMLPPGRVLVPLDFFSRFFGDVTGSQTEAGEITISR